MDIILQLVFSSILDICLIFHIFFNQISLSMEYCSTFNVSQCNEMDTTVEISFIVVLLIFSYFFYSFFFSVFSPFFSLHFHHFVSFCSMRIFWPFVACPFAKQKRLHQSNIRREVEFTRIHTLRLMLDQETKNLENLKASSNINHNEISKAEMNISRLNDQLRQLQGEVRKASILCHFFFNFWCCRRDRNMIICIILRTICSIKRPKYMIYFPNRKWWCNPPNYVCLALSLNSFVAFFCDHAYHNKTFPLKIRFYFEQCLVLFCIPTFDLEVRLLTNMDIFSHLHNISRRQ